MHRRNSERSSCSPLGLLLAVSNQEAVDVIYSQVQTILTFTRKLYNSTCTVKPMIDL